MRRRHTVAFSSIAAICIAVGLLLWFLWPKQTGAGIETVVLAGNPVIITSYTPADRTMTAIAIPETIQIEGLHGYGMYAISALWELGHIDKKDGSLLSESLAEALGVPINWYIGESVTGDASVDIRTRIKQQFSYGSVFALLSGRYRTNMNVATLFRYIGIVHEVKDIKVLDFTQDMSRIAEEQVLADGSRVWQLDISKVDVRLEHVFEEEALRREGVSVAVYNTTGIPSLGNRMARMLDHMGIGVSFVGNDTPKVETCEIAGTEAELESKSAKRIQQTFGCKRVLLEESGRADVLMRVGDDYAKRFVAW